MGSLEHKSFGKIPRLNRGIVITEKIDGTNAAIVITEAASPDERMDNALTVYTEKHGLVHVGAQSRTRIITPEDDNHGFAQWVYSYAQKIAELLGPGLHFGEWWGQGINRGYGMQSRKFSLFNVAKWTEVLNAYHSELSWPNDRLPFDVVPVLATADTFDPTEIEIALRNLRRDGSHAAWYDKPEGIVIYHTAANQMFKVLIENDDIPKSVALTQANMRLTA